MGWYLILYTWDLIRLIPSVMWFQHLQCWTEGLQVDVVSTNPLPPTACIQLILPVISISYAFTDSTDVETDDEENLQVSTGVYAKAMANGGC